MASFGIALTLSDSEDGSEVVAGHIRTLNQSSKSRARPAIGQGTGHVGGTQVGDARTVCNVSRMLCGRRRRIGSTPTVSAARIYCVLTPRLREK